MRIEISAIDSCPEKCDLECGWKRCLLPIHNLVLEPVSRLSGIYTLTQSAALMIVTALVFRELARKNENHVACCHEGWREKWNKGGGSMYKVTFTPSLTQLVRYPSLMCRKKWGWRRWQTFARDTLLRGQKPMHTFQEDLNVQDQS